jgi:hypothetical protein
MYASRKLELGDEKKKTSDLVTTVPVVTYIQYYGVMEILYQFNV